MASEISCSSAVKYEVKWASGEGKRGSWGSVTPKQGATSSKEKVLVHGRRFDEHL